MQADLLRLADLQRAMMQAVHGDAGAFAATAEAVEAAGIDPKKRLFVHLNTIDHALTAVLRQAYPATARFLDAERFADLAKAFAHGQPPRRPELSAYGAGFAAFLVERGALSVAAASLASLDWAAHEAYFAADAIPLTADRLARVPPDEHDGLRLTPVPSARLVPLHGEDAWTRWTALLPCEEVSVLAPTSGPVAGALVWRRPDLRVAARALTAGEFALLEALAGGDRLVEAAEIADTEGGADLSDLLTFCLTDGVFAASDPVPS